MKSITTKSLRLASTIVLSFGALSCGNEDDKGDNSNSPVVTPVNDQTKVIGTNPASAATDVATNRKLTVTFNQTMDPATINTETFLVTAADGSTVAGTVIYAAGSSTAIFTFVPTEILKVGTVYTATVTTGAKTTLGLSLAANYSWSFTTGNSSDATPPTVSTTLPLAAATNVPINRPMAVTFDEAIDPTTLTAESFVVVTGSGANVPGAISYTGTTAGFKSTQALVVGTAYTVTLSSAVKDLAGNALVTPYVWTFTTGADVAKGPSPVNLGAAGGFVILAKSAISTTGTTAITGDLGLSPAAQSYMTGFSETLDATNLFASSPVVTGKMFAADMTSPTPAGLTTAVSDMETAYTDAAGRSLPDFVELAAGDVSGRTLVPGLYKWGTGLLMTSDITIAGGADDVWIFQIAQDLTAANGVQVTLSGGAQAKNIYWQVAGQVKLGTTVAFKGIVLGQTQIVFQTGATLSGRALAQTAVTLDANAITQP